MRKTKNKYRYKFEIPIKVIIFDIRINFGTKTKKVEVRAFLSIFKSKITRPKPRAKGTQKKAKLKTVLLQDATNEGHYKDSGFIFDTLGLQFSLRIAIKCSNEVETHSLTVQCYLKFVSQPRIRRVRTPLAVIIESLKKKKTQYYLQLSTSTLTRFHNFSCQFMNEIDAYQQLNIS